MTQQTTAITEKELFTRALQLEREILILQSDLKQLKEDATYSEGDNPKGIEKGIEKGIVADILKAAKFKAKDSDLLEQIEKLQTCENIIEEMSV